MNLGQDMISIVKEFQMKMHDHNTHDKRKNCDLVAEIQSSFYVKISTDIMTKLIGIGGESACPSIN